jgi:hypothetical protein
VLAAASYPGASVRGTSWASRELSAWPHSVQGLSDAATFDIALGRHGAARRALARARALDPVDPALRTQARRLATPSTR